MIHISPFHIHSFMILGDEDDAVRYGWVGKIQVVCRTQYLPHVSWTRKSRPKSWRTSFWAPRGPEIWEGLDFQPPILRVNRNCRPSRQPTIISKCLLDLCINLGRHIGYVGRSLSGGSLGERLDQTHRCRFRQDSLRNGLKSRVCSKDATVATFKVCEGILAC